MNKYIFSISIVLISGCDTSINTRQENNQNDLYSSNDLINDVPVNSDFSNSTNAHILIPTSESVTMNHQSSDEMLLIPVDQLKHEQPNTKLKEDVLKWQEANLETYDTNEGSVLNIN